MVGAMTRTRTAILALTLAGALWGLTVPLSKLSLEWLGGGWLTVARFLLAAPLLVYVGRRGLRDAVTPGVAGAGAIGFGIVILLQNAGIERTSVSHAALLVGAVPVMVALLAAGLGRGAGRPLAWAGYAVALGGLAMVASGGGSGAMLSGDLLVLGSVALSATFIVVQPRLLAGRDPAAVTAVQFAAGALVALPHAVVFEGLPPAPVSALPVVALVALAFAGTLLPFWLFAYGQSHVTPELAGAFLNLEPLVGAAVGWVGFGETADVRPARRGGRRAGGHRAEHDATIRPMLPVFDGHNDTLTRDDADRFATGREGGDIDLPRARQGGLAGGIFAAFTATPSFAEAEDEAEIAAPISQDLAAANVARTLGRLIGLERDGHVRIARAPGDLDAAREAGVLAAVAHVEGAEAIDPGLDALDALVRRRAALAGPGLEPPERLRPRRPVRLPLLAGHRPGADRRRGRAGAALRVELGIAVDLSHLNEAGFWDVARTRRRTADRLATRAPTRWRSRAAT